MPEVKIIKADPERAAEIRSAKNGCRGRKMRVAAYCRVSTDAAEQKESFESQVTYYKGQIDGNPDWESAGIYADEGISETQAKKRPEFMRMIGDAMAGKIDMILVKSLSRFARNTVDALNYIRMLKDKGVDVRFEEEKIDTLSQKGDFTITILSSVAQQEVQNTSEHVKRGLAMKAQQGLLIGNASCPGYAYDPTKKEIVIDEKEAEIVRYIFRRYVEGAGTTVIGHELEDKGWKTKRGYAHWGDTAILGVISNEKCVGDLLQGKTYTTDPISHHRIRNNGEGTKYYVSNHHEPIIDRETFEKANAIRKRRSYSRVVTEDGSRVRFSREYPLSSAIECANCHRRFSRRVFNKKNPVWQCLGFFKHGKESCPFSKAISEKAIYDGFVASYNKLLSNGESIADEFIARSKDAIARSGLSDKASKNEAAIKAVKDKQERLLAVYMGGDVSQESYQKSYRALSAEMSKLAEEKSKIELAAGQEADIVTKLSSFTSNARGLGSKPLKDFDPDTFNVCIEKIIAGEKKEDGSFDPFVLTYIFKRGFGKATKIGGGLKYSVVYSFPMYWRHFVFLETKHGKRKELHDTITINVAIAS